MKVPDIKGLLSIARGALDPKRGQPGTAARGPDARADQVELSPEGLDVRKAAETGRLDSAARAALVAELKVLYEKGELTADAEAIALEMFDKGLFDDLLRQSGDGA